MASQLGSGRWLATRVRQGKSSMKIFDTEEEAIAYEEGNDGVWVHIPL